MTTKLAEQLKNNINELIVFYKIHHRWMKGFEKVFTPFIENNFKLISDHYDGKLPAKELLLFKKSFVWFVQEKITDGRLISEKDIIIFRNRLYFFLIEISLRSFLAQNHFKRLKINRK